MDDVISGIAVNVCACFSPLHNVVHQPRSFVGCCPQLCLALFLPFSDCDLPCWIRELPICLTSRLEVKLPAWLVESRLVVKLPTWLVESRFAVN